MAEIQSQLGTTALVQFVYFFTRNKSIRDFNLTW